MLVAVAATSIGIYVVLEGRADQAINDALDGRATTIAGTLGDGIPEIGDEEPFAVVLDSTGAAVPGGTSESNSITI